MIVETQHALQLNHKHITDQKCHQVALVKGRLTSITLQLQPVPDAGDGAAGDLPRRYLPFHHPLHVGHDLGLALVTLLPGIVPFGYGTPTTAGKGI